CVVPVVEVAAVTLEFFRRCERASGALEQIANGNVAEIVSGQVREERQSDVGRRRAMRGAVGRFLLDVVWREVVVDRADVSFKVPPRTPRDRSEENTVLFRQPRPRR